MIPSEDVASVNMAVRSDPISKLITIASIRYE